MPTSVMKLRGTLTYIGKKQTGIQNGYSRLKKKRTKWNRAQQKMPNLGNIDYTVWNEESGVNLITPGKEIKVSVMNQMARSGRNGSSMKK